jgi:ribosomal protein L11 methyltransferase
MYGIWYLTFGRKRSVLQMKWKKFKIKTITEAEDIIISTLYDIGLEGAQIEDKVPLTAMEKEQMFVDILPEGPEDDGVAYLSFFVEEDEKGTLMLNGSPSTEEEILTSVREELDGLRMFCEIGEGSIFVDETEDIDWINNWKQYFKQFYVDDILIIPSWEEVKEEDKDKMIIHIDPGTAFGTGMHETTQLCIRQLKKYVTPETELLDVGTGSGILSIIALKLGAKHAVGTDLDPCAVPAVEENKEVNGILPEAFDMMIGNIIDDKEVQDRVGYEKYDIVVANILADVLVPLTPVIVNQMKPGGIYITSGIIDEKEETVTEAVKAAGLEVVEVTYQGEWVSVTARKQG